MRGESERVKQRRVAEPFKVVGIDSGENCPSIIDWCSFGFGVPFRQILGTVHLDPEFVLISLPFKKKI